MGRVRLRPDLPNRRFRGSLRRGVQGAYTAHDICSSRPDLLGPVLQAAD